MTLKESFECGAFFCPLKHHERVSEMETGCVSPNNVIRPSLILKAALGRGKSLVASRRRVTNIKVKNCVSCFDKMEFLKSHHPLSCLYVEFS